MERLSFGTFLSPERKVRLMARQGCLALRLYFLFCQLALGPLGELDHRTVRRADVRAGAALEAVEHAVLFRLLELPLLDEPAEQPGVKPHRAGLYAPAAADARADVEDLRLLARQRDDAGGALYDRDHQRGLGYAHHRPAHDDLRGCIRQPAALLYQLIEQRADADAQVFGLPDAGAG